MRAKEQTVETIGTRFIAALARQDWNELQSCFHDAVQFRALIPSGLREANDSTAAAHYFQKWFGDSDQLELLASDAHAIQDRFYITYRFHAHEDRWYIVEQQAYFTISDERIDRMNLLCSGFRPESDSA